MVSIATAVRLDQERFAMVETSDEHAPRRDRPVINISTLAVAKVSGTYLVVDGFVIG
jgi:hypothetical protein